MFVRDAKMLLFLVSALILLESRDKEYDHAVSFVSSFNLECSLMLRPLKLLKI